MLAAPNNARWHPWGVLNAVDRVMTGLLRPLVDQDLAVVFYYMTTIRTAGLCDREGDVRKFGMSPPVPE